MKSPILRPSGHDQNEPTSVYVLTCEGRVKIGIAAVVSARVEHLQLACPLPITIAHERQFPTRTNARLVERSLHSRFGARRLHGEWFDMDPAEAIAAVRDAEEVAAPVSIPGRLRKAERPVVPVDRAPRKTPEPRAQAGGPTFEELEAMDEDTWLDFMRPCATTLDFLDPDAHEKSRAMEAELRMKYPQYYQVAA